MCGIAGFIVNRSYGDKKAEILHTMTAAINHRGPDDEGFFSNLTLDGMNVVGLGHRRLSIIDLAGGHQPMGNEDGSIQLVFNGEIYNFEELRNDLLARGHQFKTNSDTETIVHAYEEYGVDCIRYFNGMFAFALWDAKQERLFLARDRFGKKPLFISEKQGVLLFASEIKAILTFPNFTAKVNQKALWSYLAYRYVPGPATLFEGIRKLMPGTWAIWERGQLKEQRYYSPPDQLALRAPVEPDDPISLFLEQLDEAVKIRMVSDVPFGAFLSGGIDSSAVVGLMARHSSLPIQTFSIGFEKFEYSELAHASLVAKHFNCSHHEISVSEKHLMDELPRLIYFRDAPVSEPSDIPIYLLSKQASRSVKMVLTGEGSDEVLGGYPKHVFERYVQVYQRLPRLARRSLIEPIIYNLPYKFRRAKTAILNLGLENIEERFPRWFGALSYEERAKLLALHWPSDTAIADHEVQFRSDTANSALRRILYFDQTSWLPDNLLERGDRMTMAASLEARMPFLDYNLASFVSSLPDRYRIRGWKTKWILREAMKQLLPKRILERPKVGFRVPVNEWFQGPMREYLYDHLLGSHALTRDYYQREELEKTVNEHVRGRQNHEKLLWTLLNLELWHRQYKVSK